jgi:hypothetical protein
MEMARVASLGAPRCRRSGDVNWDAIAGVASVAAVVAALIAVWIQMRQLKQSFASATYQEIVRMFDEFAMLIVERPELDRAIFGGRGVEERFSDETRTRAQWAQGIRFDWFESIVIQRRKYRVIPDDLYDHWFAVLRDELGRPGMRDYWNRCGHYYHPELRSEVERAISSLRVGSRRSG